MRNFRALVVATAIFSVPCAASAHQWVIFNATTNTCERAPADDLPASASPQSFIDATRADGILSTVQEHKLPDGTLTVVTIETTINGNDVTVYYFPTMDYCKTFLSTGQKDGLLPNSSDLK